MTSQKGFTIIELLVVIAIIAVLAGIVLVNVTSYINKGKDAAIKGNLSTMMVNAAIHFDTNGRYDSPNFCTTSGYTVPEAAAVAAGSANPVEICALSAFCSCATLKTGTNQTYCVDSTGYKKQTGTVCSTRCPAAGGCVD